MCAGSLTAGTSSNSQSPRDDEFETHGIFLARVNPRGGYQSCSSLVTRRGHDEARTKEIQSDAIHNWMLALGHFDRIYTVRSAEPVSGKRSQRCPVVDASGADAARRERSWFEGESGI